MIEKQENDLYEILGVSPNAPTNVIAAAYRELAKAFHPDRSKDPEGEEKFKKISLAAEILRDPAKREEYDRQREQINNGNGSSFNRHTRDKFAFWEKHESWVTPIMEVWKDDYFSSSAVIYRNDDFVAIPPIESPELTIPNIVCRGSMENAGIWCEESGDMFVVAVFSITDSYVAYRRYITADGLFQALDDCALEIKFIRQKSMGYSDTQYSRDDVIRELLAGDKRRLSGANGGNFYTEDTLEALFYLASSKNTEVIILKSLERWARGGSRHLRMKTSNDNRSRIDVVHYDEVCAAFAYLAQSKIEALEYLTDAIIKGWKDRIPLVEHVGLIDVFLTMNPKETLPETKNAINRILNSGMNDRYGKLLRKFKGELPGAGLLDWLGL